MNVKKVEVVNLVLTSDNRLVNSKESGKTQEGKSKYGKKSNIIRYEC